MVDISKLTPEVRALFEAGQAALAREGRTKAGVNASRTKAGLVLVTAPGLPKGGIRLTDGAWRAIFSGSVGAMILEAVVECPEVPK